MRLATTSEDAGGFLIPIGGAEDRIRTRTILSSFVQLCGGRRAHIAVIPTASSLRDTGSRYETVFRDLGVDRVSVLPFETRRDCETRRYLDRVDQADGVFMTGGDQLYLSRTSKGTPVAERLRIRHADGVHIAGTSAGAAVISEHMIASGDRGSTPRAEMVDVAPGLGLTRQLVIDQHFRQRDRLGRLLAALARYPGALGLGLDEDTAAFIGPNRRLDVVGSGAITIVDPVGLDLSVDATSRDGPLKMLNLRVHVLVDGCSYDLETRTAYS